MHFSRIAKWKNLTENAGVSTGVAVKRDERGRLVVPVYSGFFSSLTDNVMCTNAMFETLKKEVDSSVAPYSSKEEVVLTVFESSSGSDEDVKESVLVGFRRYIGFYRKKAVFDLKTHLIVFALMFAGGVLLEFLLYGGGYLSDLLPLWVVNTLDIVAWVFVWQFAAYMAFEFFREIQTIRRLMQILKIEYVFRHWE